MEIANLIKVLKESEVNSHFWHLQTNSFAKHKALEIWYTDIVDIIDSLVESWQGSYNTRLSYPSTLELTPYNECETYFRNLCTLLESKIKECDSSCLDIQDIILDAKNLCNKICYLLTLK